ncbi:oligopeptide ABC transporter substrate-binding protein [Carnobacterium sp. PL12RED10]|uniref:oligopeptide ABC transporter substrate-binding protein n=1 Tax=Carnobacterium sp. PL12RED10 TaxID=2592351 RepID=UPI0011ED6533|nr:oligopeptide ABC transporter substrate-binding protein [Carnobacterium sp. PL12RED10]KAF3301678.1 oligopeptide ABC transporter substrate-binding protein [Carnobacterium sp. PL12RED10]
MKKWYRLLGLTAAASLALVACGNSDSDSETADSSSSSESGEVVAPELAATVDNEGEAIDGGTLQVGLVTDSPFQGIFSWEFYEDAYDFEIMQFGFDSLFGTDDDFQIDDSGKATLALDQENNKATITLKEGLKWSDGEPLTAEDVIYSYEVIGHPDYTGIRYDGTFQNVVGMEEYHSGEADTISGITQVDDVTVEIEFQEVSPSMLQAGGGVWSYAMPKHYLEDVPVAELASSEKIRSTPVGDGPFRITKVTPGESVEYEANEYYWQGEPKLDNVVVEVVPSSSVVPALENGKYDVALSMPTDLYASYAELPGYTLLGREQLSYTYIGFKLGKWDAEAGEVVYDEDAKMADKSLRQAMGYAIDNDAVAQRFYNGLRSNANTVIPPVFGSFGATTEEVPGYSYDPDRANQLLDDAGYVDTDNDGIREDSDGEPLQINFASMEGGETAEPIAQYYIQAWNEVGLDVQLTDGRLLEFNSFYDRIEADDENIDIYQAAWGTGSDPAPNGLYARNAAFNYTRWATEENDQFMADFTSSEAFDEEFQRNTFVEWQKYFSEEAPVIPTLFRQQVMPVNNRVKHFDYAHNPADDFGWHTVEVTADAPVSE